jgi:hypothetical protein
MNPLFKPVKTITLLPGPMARTNNECLYNARWSCPLTPFENRLGHERLEEFKKPEQILMVLLRFTS